MATLWVEADVFALERLASLVDLAADGVATAALLAEMRQLEDRFGLSPMARLRLRWQLEEAGKAHGTRWRLRRRSGG